MQLLHNVRKEILQNAVSLSSDVFLKFYNLISQPLLILIAQ